MTNTSNIKILVRSCYDLQKLRIQMGNRLCANFRSKLGWESNKPEEDVDQKIKEVMKELRTHYKRIADGMKKMSAKEFVGDGIISSFTEFVLLDQYFDLEASETKTFSKLGDALKDFRIYNEFLKGVKGIGPAMAGVIVAEINIEKARHPSSIWKYAGLDVGDDGMGRSRRSEHLVKVQYKDKNGKDAERNSITFNPFLKTKLIGVLGSSFLKCKSPYSEIYYNTRTRLESHAVYGTDEISKGRRHNMAMRKMVKMFLIDLYVKWRTIEGLTVSLPYHEAKLGLVHGGESVAVVSENQRNEASLSAVENHVS